MRMSFTPPSAREIFRGFGAFHAEKIAPFLQRQELKRQQALAGFYAAFGVGCIGAVLVLRFDLFGPDTSAAAASVAGAGFALGAGILGRARADITHGLLALIAGRLGFAYIGKADRPELLDHFRRLKLVPHHDREFFENDVRGEYAGGPFTFCEAKLDVKTSGRKSRRRTVFHGQLIAIGYPKRFCGSTVVHRDQGVFNAMTKPGADYRRVGLASPIFEKAFEVWSTDQVEARDLLDPVVLERFQELERLFGGKKLRAAFDGGKLLIALETGDRLTVGTMFKPIEGAARVETILKEFDTIFDLIDILLARLDRPVAGAFSLGDVKPRSAHHG